MTTRKKNHSTFAACRNAVIALGLFVFGPSAFAATVDLTHRVDATDNLFFTSWGHTYTDVFVPNQPLVNGIESFGLKAGTEARSVQDTNGAFNFAGFGSVNISASGLIYAKGGLAVDPNGKDQNGIIAVDKDPNARWFRDLEVYSLLGIWSSTADHISPIGNTFAQNGNSGPHSAPAFSIGSLNTLLIPQGPAVYLFLAINDGYFADNGIPQNPFPAANNWFDVALRVSSVTAVPLPAPIVLLGSAMVLMFGRSRRRSV